MPELTEEEALESESAWTDEEIEWIYSVGGHIYGDASDEADRQREQAEERERSVWDSISDYFEDIYDIAKGAASDVLTPIWDWFTEKFDRMDWANAVLMGDVWTEVDRASDEVYGDSFYVISDIEDYINEEVEEIEEQERESKGLIFDYLDKGFEGIATAFEIAFQHLAPVFALLLEIPARVLFKLFTEFFFEEVD